MGTDGRPRLSVPPPTRRLNWSTARSTDPLFLILIGVALDWKATTSACSARTASAAPNSAASSQRCAVERFDIALAIEPETSTMTNL